MENLSKKTISSNTQFIRGDKKERRERKGSFVFVFVFVCLFCFFFFFWSFCLSFNPNKRTRKPLTAGSIVKPGNRSASYPNWVGLEIQADFCERMITLHAIGL